MAALISPIAISVKGKIVTELAPLKTWYNAEDYHQDYLFENPNG
jgi:peptide methionine sulfoxide reductase MsrA